MRQVWQCSFELAGRLCRTTCAGVVLVFLSALAVPALAQEVVMGAALSLSGANASFGENAKVGMELAVDEINAAGGVLGRKIRVQYQDTGGDRAKAIALYRGFAAQKDTVASFAASSSEMIALNPVTADAKLPLVILGASYALEKFSAWTFRLALVFRKALPSVLARLRDTRNVKTIAILYDSTDSSLVSEMEAIKLAVADLGIKITNIEAFSRGDQNFSLQLTRINQSKPDAIWIAAVTDEAALSISQARSLGLTSMIVGGIALNDTRIGTLAGPAANGVITFALYNPDDERIENQKFLRLFKAKYPKEVPSSFNALGYDVVHLVAAGLRKAGSADRDALRKALGSGDQFMGVNGPVRFAESGDNLVQSPVLLSFKDGAYVLLKD